MPAAVANPGTSTEAPSSQPSFMENLVSPDNESTIDGLFEGSTQDGEGQQEYADSGSDQQDTAGTGQSTAQGPADELIQLIAEDTGLDPSIPAQREAIERLAASQKFVDRLQGKGQAQDEGGLTAFERSLMEPDENGQTGAPAETAVTKPVQEQPVQQLVPGQYGDIGDSWKTPEDSIVALSEAYARNDTTAVHNIELARFVRMFNGYGRRHIEALIQEKFKGLEGIEEFIPSLRQGHEDRRYETHRNAAMEGLSAEKGFEDIHDLGKAQDGPPVQLDGKSYPNTPLNQIVARNEWIRDVRVQHPDPNKAMQLTIAKQLRAVYSEWKKSQSTINPAQVKTLVNSAAKMGERQANDVTRQRLNAGTGSTKVGGGSKQPSFMEGLTKSGGGEFSVADLLARK